MVEVDFGCVPIGLLKRGLVLELIRLFELAAGRGVVLEERVVARFVEVDDCCVPL